MPHGVVIRKSTILHPTDSIYSSRRLQLQVIEVCKVSPAIFVFETQIINAQTLEKKGVFKNVATPADLTELSVDTPATGATLFRKSSVDLLVRSPNMEEAVWEAIYADAETLMLSLDDLDGLIQYEEVTVSG